MLLRGEKNLKNSNSGRKEAGKHQEEHEFNLKEFDAEVEQVQQAQQAEVEAERGTYFQARQYYSRETDMIEGYQMMRVYAEEWVPQPPLHFRKFANYFCFPKH